LESSAVPASAWAFKHGWPGADSQSQPVHAGNYERLLIEERRPYDGAERLATSPIYMSTILNQGALMARILSVRAPQSMELRRMKSEEIEKQVSAMADEALERLPKGANPVGINAVSLSQHIPGTNADPGVWAEWTRACCNRRDKIDDFVDPVVDQFERPDSAVAQQIGAQHLESQLKIVHLEHPTMHVKANK
jgi:hypothetical protein